MRTHCQRIRDPAFDFEPACNLMALLAMTQTLAGDPGAAVQQLLTQGKQTLSGKLIETAYLVLNRYRDQIAQAQTLTTEVQTLRDRYNTPFARPVLGEQKRQAGRLTLRTDAKVATGTVQSA